MSMLFKNVIGIIDHSRKFDSNELIESEKNWSFKYTTQNIESIDSDVTIDGGEIDYNKEHYSKDTIFFDTEPDEIYMYSTVENVVINSIPPEFIKSHVYYTTVLKDHKCEFTFKANSPIDIRQLKINCDDINLYYINRKTEEVESSLYIHDIIINKIGDNYTLSFYISQDKALEEKLNESQLTITVWDITGNWCECKTTGKWVNVDSEEELYDLQHLEIIFENYTPENKILLNNIEGEVTVSIYNPNKNFWSIEPIVELDSESLGFIDESTKSYDPDNGTLSFKIISINTNGDVKINSWLSVDNTEIYEVIRNSTYTSALLGPWLAEDEGRKYNLLRYVPEYMNDEHFYNYIDFVQTFLNTCFTSVDNGKHISVLEKIARINNFNDVQKIEKKYIDEFRKTYNIEVNPNLVDLKEFLEHKTVTTETKYTKTILNDESTIYRTSNGVTVKNTDIDKSYKTDVIKETKNAYNSEITLDDLTEMMRYVYKTIPYYNQIKGTEKGIKIILNTLGLASKLVNIWSEHKTVNNINNKNLERRADELGANIADYDYDSVDIDVGKYYLTSRFDVDLLQTDLTFREFNKVAKNIVNIIFQIKPVTRVLRKLSYIFSTNTNLHLKYFNLVDANIHQYYCFNYIWDLFDKYSLSKSIHDVDAKTCNKLFIPFKSKLAEVTYLCMANHDKEYTDGKLCSEGMWDVDGSGKAKSIARGTLITRNANKNTFFNLANIELKTKVSNLSVLHVYYTYLEEKQQTIITKDNSDIENPIKIEFTNELYSNGNLIQNLKDKPEYNISEIIEKNNISYDLIIPKQVKISSETNGFNLEFDRSSIALLRKTNYRNTLSDTISEIIEEEYKSITTTIKPIGLFLQLKFAIPLGTRFITQYLGNNKDIDIINPDNDIIIGPCNTILGTKNYDLYGIMTDDVIDENVKNILTDITDDGQVLLPEN